MSTSTSELGVTSYLQLLQGGHEPEAYDYDIARRPDRLYGVKDLRLAEFISGQLRAAGARVELDVGQRGWPATLWIGMDCPAETQKLIKLVLGAVDSSVTRIIQNAPDRESLRISTFRAVRSQLGTVQLREV